MRCTWIEVLFAIFILILLVYLSYNVGRMNTTMKEYYKQVDNCIEQLEEFTNKVKGEQ